MSTSTVLITLPSSSSTFTSPLKVGNIISYIFSIPSILTFWPLMSRRPLCPLTALLTILCLKLPVSETDTPFAMTYKGAFLKVSYAFRQSIFRPPKRQS